MTHTSSELTPCRRYQFVVGAVVRFGLEYAGYSKFNGTSVTYDGFGRNAKDNNTRFGYVWLAF